MKPARLQYATAAPGVQIVSLAGSVGLAEARELERHVIDGVRLGHTRVVVDLSGVTDVGPGLLGMLLRIRRGISRVEGRLVLVAGGPPVDEFVRTSVLAALVTVAADRNEALTLVGEAAGDRS